MKNGRRTPTKNIYEYLDPLSCPGDAYDEEKTSAAIKSMMGVQKRAQKKRLLPELTPIEEPQVDQAEPPAAETEQPAAPDLQTKSDDIARAYRRVFSAVVNKWWLVAMILAVLFHEIVLAAIIIAAVLTLLMLTLFGPEALLDSVARDWRKHTRPAKVAWPGFSDAGNRVLAMINAGKTRLAGMVPRISRRSPPG